MAGALFRTFIAIGLSTWLSVARAEVIELEGTVKAVDADARTISIERKTAKGTKTLDLEVNKKAGDLSVVKVGEKIAFSYDPDLELVTKIGEGGKPVERSTDLKACRIRIAFTDTGNASVQVEPITLAPQSGKDSREDLGDGVWRLTHYFAKPKDLTLFDSVLGSSVNAEVDENNQRLMLAPEKSPGFDNPAAQCVYPFRLRVPFEIEVDVTTTAKEGWPFMQIYAVPRGKDMQRPVFEFRTTSALKDGLVFGAWSSKMGEKEQNHIAEAERLDFKEKWEKKFRLAVPNVRSKDFYALTIGCLGPPADKTFIHRLAVKGFLVPLLGMQIDQKGDVVFVTRVVPKALAAKAGAKEGDVILSINGTKPTSAVAAVELMAETGFGDTCDIAIKRGDEDIALALKPTWDD